jgi:hypothetical protein
VFIISVLFQLRQHCVYIERVTGVIKRSDDVSVGVVCIFSPGTRVGPIPTCAGIFLYGGRSSGGVKQSTPSNGEFEDAWSSTPIASYAFMM